MQGASLEVVATHTDAMMPRPHTVVEVRENEQPDARCHAEDGQYA
jgi:hypothetical protein